MTTNSNQQPAGGSYPRRLQTFVTSFEALLETGPSEETLLRSGEALLRNLVSHDDWLPEAFARPSTSSYRQYLLHLDPQERFSVVSFVWGPGQSTPIHDHTVWGLIGMLRGSEVEQHYARQADGTLAPEGEPHVLQQGAVDCVSPSVGDLHRVSNAYQDRVSISIHVYGSNIGAVERSVYTADGGSKTFISGYSNAPAGA